MTLCPNCPGPLQMQPRLVPMPPGNQTEPSSSNEPSALLWIVGIALLIQTVAIVGWIIRSEIRERARENAPVADTTPGEEALLAEMAAIRGELEKMKGTDNDRFTEIGLRLAKLMRQLEATDRFSKDGAAYLQQLIEDRLCEAMARQVLEREEARRKAAAAAGEK